MAAEDGAVTRAGVRENGRVIAAATVSYKAVAGGWGYLFSPRGPVFAAGTEKASALAALARYFAQAFPRALFWRLEPAGDPGPASGRFVLLKTISLEPAETLVLDLTRSEDDLLADMHQKTRYNIRLAEKKGVAIGEVTAPSDRDWQEFSRLMSLTGSRDGFRVHSLAHYRRMVEKSQGSIRLWFATYGGEAVAAGIFAFWSSHAGYLHGASDSKHRRLMAPHLLQWTVIRQAKARGQKEYDFYGIDETKWPGVSRFKLGFGGQRRHYAGTYDLVFRPVSYKLYALARRLRRLV